MDAISSPQPPDPRSASTADLLSWRDTIVAEVTQHFAAGRIAEAVGWLHRLESATTDDRTLALTDRFLAVVANGRRIVATTDSRRRPAADEVVIIYGNYPHCFGNVIVNNPIRRHVADWWKFHHDIVEYDARWDSIERIFIINADRRRDRLDGVLRELAIARAPLDRISRVPAVMVDPHVAGPAAGQIGCMSSHLVALREIQRTGRDNVLVLEDDFCFTTDLEQHLDDLGEFLRRAYDYWICLVATSKYGPVVARDDLIAETHQECTNTGGYLISAAGVDQLIPVYEEALEHMKRTGVTVPWAVDRSWAVLQPSGQFLVFKRKLGFQNSGYSDIEQTISRYLD